jgi:hypothetical protein
MNYETGKKYTNFTGTKFLQIVNIVISYFLGIIIILIITVFVVNFHKNNYKYLQHLVRKCVYRSRFEREYVRY